jgi:hypothetical protein
MLKPRDQLLVAAAFPASATAFITKPFRIKTPLSLVNELFIPINRKQKACFSTQTSLPMALVPLSVDDLDRLLVVSGAPTGEQTATYWGRTQRERYGRIFESSVVTILGVLFSYFLSFVAGTFVATILGSLFFFWSVFSPQLQAYQRNWELRGGRDLIDPWLAGSSNDEYSNDDDGEKNRLGLYGALFLGRVKDVSVVEEASAAAEDEYALEDFADYSMEEDELERWAGIPYLLRVKAEDRGGRTLQVHARMSEEYLDVVPGTPVLGVMLSASPRFTSLAALTDLYVPDKECWIGDYPYLNRAEMEQLLATDNEVWELLQNELKL